MTEEKTADIGELVRRLDSHMGKQDVAVLLADCREAARAITALAREATRSEIAYRIAVKRADNAEAELATLRDCIEREPVVKPSDPAIAFQNAEEAICECGAAGSGEGHSDFCPWLESAWKQWGDAVNASAPERVEAGPIAYADLTGTKEEAWYRSIVSRILKHHDVLNGVLEADLVSAILASPPAPVVSDEMAELVERAIEIVPKSFVNWHDAARAALDSAPEPVEEEPIGYARVVHTSPGILNPAVTTEPLTYETGTPFGFYGLTLEQGRRAIAAALASPPAPVVTDNALVQALEPFAKLFDRALDEPGLAEDDDTVFFGNKAGRRVTYGDFRRARAALASREAT